MLAIFAIQEKKALNESTKFQPSHVAVNQNSVFAAIAMLKIIFLKMQEH